MADIINGNVDKMEKAKNEENIENGSYEIIKSRLKKQGKELKQRLEQLNTNRKTVFGAVETALLGSERIITDNNCVPRDIAPVGSQFIFGYNVHMGLKSKVELENVFSIYEFKDRSFHKLSLSMIQDKQFLSDFTELYTYYKNTFFAKFSVSGIYLYMIFQIGKNSSDIKAFKWLIEKDKLTYIDNRSDHEVKASNESEFKWERVRREDQREGLHPHISIQDKLFVETIGGDLTIKVEDNTTTGKGIHSEPVEDKDQTLDDSEIYYAVVGHLVALKIRPYKEKEFRYFIFNTKLQNVIRIDAIKDACMFLPDNHGLIFPKGYYLQSGEYKVFDVEHNSFVFEQRIDSPNGEDFQYIFYNPENGMYLVYSYNLIAQSLESPIICSGYSHFQNGEMIVFKHENEPRKNHMLQIWQTPYVGKNFILESQSDSTLFNIGNKEIVRCMADCTLVFNIIQKEESYTSIYVDIVKNTIHIMDSYFWISKKEAFNIKEVLNEIKETSSHAVAEFEKVIKIKGATEKQMNAVEIKAHKLIKESTFGNIDHINQYVEILEKLRIIRGEIVSLKDLRYCQMNLIEGLEAKIKEQNEIITAKCIQYLLKPEGLKPYLTQVQSLKEKVLIVDKTFVGKAIEADIGKISNELELLINIVSNFKIEDPTQTTQIIDNISSIYSLLNQAKATLVNRLASLASIEGTTQFHSQMKLLDQTVLNFLELSDSTEKCEEYQNKVMVQIQELEGKFADYDEYIIELTGKREELYNAFEAKRQNLTERKNKKLASLFSTVERILSGIKNRLNSFNTLEEMNGYFAGDLMLEKVRDIVAQFNNLGDNVKADEVDARLKTIREDAVRQLKDKQELFVNGKNVIKLGKNLFSVNMQQLDISVVQKEMELYLHITGTDFWEKGSLSELNAFRHIWDQNILSENRDVYRGEYLAYKIFEAYLEKGTEGMEELSSPGSMGEQLLAFVQKFMEPRYLEGYIKGVHDVDCCAILKTLINLYTKIDLLTFSPATRALAQIYWRYYARNEYKERLITRMKELAKVSVYFTNKPDLMEYIPAVAEDIEQAIMKLPFLDKKLVTEAATYLCMELMKGSTFIISLETQEVYEGFIQHLKTKNAYSQFTESLKKFNNDLEGSVYLIKEWVTAFINDTQSREGQAGLEGRESLEGQEVIDEVANLLLFGGYDSRNVIKTKTKSIVGNLIGNHPNINNGELTISYCSFMERLKHFDTCVVSDFTAYQNLKRTITDKYKEELRLDEFRPQILSSFVRNKLIDEVYLPLIGNNLAKQIGVAGETKRTDLMGMLLLISPPGYGKTTLVEYIANRLGITLIKINGPAIGNSVTSLDPAAANNASSKEELRKLNLAFKMGNNVMIYVDDIQHCNPEFLQKFIPLCDGQRKIEGVYNGVGQTYDLKGKKVVVVMAGNPYTECGDKFQIPDMLANRADVYNLGDMLRENSDAFMLSYIENCLTSNPILARLSSKSQKDVYTFIQIASGGSKEDLNFEGNYAAEEINEIVTVIEKLLKIRDIVLKINLEYIYSAAQAEDYRKEPPFKLQGSYRNMNKIAEKIVPVMNQQEIDEIMINSYVNDAQTLTTGAEANMLKWKEITGCLSNEESQRWQEIKEIYIKNKNSCSEDKMGQAVIKLGDVGGKLEMIKDVLAKGLER